MLDAVKRYATQIVLIHLALLLVVGFVVIGAAREVRNSAQEEAQSASRANVQRFAEQAGNGIQSNYRSIFSTLDVVLRDDSGTGGGGAATMPASTMPGAAETGRRGAGGGGAGGGGLAARGGRGGGGRGRGFVRPNPLSMVNLNEATFGLLWKQLKGPVSQIFLVDTTNGNVVDSSMAPGLGAAGGAGAAAGGAGGAGNAFSKYVYPQDSFDAATKIVQDEETLKWLREVASEKVVAMSNFHPGDASLAGAANGYHLIAVPAPQVNIGQGGGGLNGVRGGGGGGGPGGGGNAGQGGRGFGRRGGGPGPGAGGGPGGRGEPGPGAPGGGPGNFGPPGGPGPEGALPPPNDPNFANGAPAGGGPGGPAANSAAGPGPVAAPSFAIVVVVPVEVAADEFLTPLNTPADSTQGNASPVHAILVNDSGQVLVSNKLLAAGANLLDQIPEQAVKEQIRGMVARGDSADPKLPDSVIFAEAFHIGGTLIEPQIMGTAQFSVPSGHRWTVLVASPLSDTNEVVNRVFHSALSWSIALSLAIAGILASTSFFLIRSRVGFERTRHELLTRELEQARQIQLAWLPDMKSVPAGLEVSAVNLPASHISGDFYNWFALPRVPGLLNSAASGAAAGEGERPGKVAIVIGDVTGHGMAAAFLMATTQLLVRMTLSRHADPGRCLREVNQQLCAQAGSSFKGQFVTMLVMVLDAQTGKVQIASAGHPPPLVEVEGAFRSLALEPQLVLGVNDDEQYNSQTFMLEPGASVLLYTDGVVEAESATGAQYGVENLLKLMQAQGRHGGDGGGEAIEPAGRIRSILENVKRFCNGRELADDVTLVAIRTTGAAVASNVASAKA